MRLLLDQNIDARLIPYLDSWGHDVIRIGREHPHDLADDQILALAYAEQRIVITNDRDFGELVFSHGRPHAGVILFRLGSADLPTKVARLSEVLTQYSDQLDHFIVVTLDAIRVRQA
jgi:predicted nuclease of predicted toxin-antitoxin system